ncbi:MAG: DUF4910 domain-containing protein [Fervidicoccaceae archaeon]
MEQLRELVGPGEIASIASYLSSIHRIQGSPGILEVGRAISDFLSDNGIDSEIHIFQHDSSLFPYDSDLVAWKIEDSALRILSPTRMEISTFLSIPTSVVAHSPPGSFSGEIAILERGRKEKQGFENRILLARDFSFESYLAAVNGGAQAIIFYRRTGSPTAFPYFSLFPSHEDLNLMKIPALTISRLMAEKIEGWIERGRKVEVEGFVNSKYGEVASIPVVETAFGEDGYEYHLTAHMCHPGLTVNDNISGVAGLIAAALSMKRANLEEKILNKRLVFLWVPEFSGTIAYLRTAIGRRKIMGAINLDMIGEIEELSGSSLNFIRPPIHLLSSMEPVLLKELFRSLPKSRSFSSPSEIPLRKFWITNYEAGSDHDIYISMGIPAVMINSWPDRFYHSSEDTMEKFDPRSSIFIGVAALKSAISNGEDGSLSSYFSLVSGLDLLKASAEAAPYVRSLYCIKAEELGLSMEGCYGKASNLTIPEPLLKVTMTGYPNNRLMRRKLSSEDYEKIVELLESKPWLRTINVLLSSMLKWRDVGIEGARRIAMGELGTAVDPADMSILINAWRSLGLIK